MPSCAPCNKSQLQCDQERPCRNCISSGKPSMCATEDKVSKKNSIPRVELQHTPPTSPTKIDSNNSNGVTVEEIPMDLAFSPPKHALPARNQPYKSHFNFNPSAAYKSVGPHRSQPPANFSLLKRSQPRTQNDQQANLNTHFFQEIKKLRENQERQQEELLTLKLQNLQLTKMLARGGDENLYLQNLSHSAMVVFDLHSTPAKVLSANDTFCDMVGYRPDEVLGMPWQNFIPPDYIERTLKLLFHGAADRKNNVVHIEQLYKTKDGAVFNAYDTHTIFFSNDKPASDVVFISLEPTPAHIQIKNRMNYDLEKTAQNKPELAQRANQLLLENAAHTPAPTLQASPKSRVHNNNNNEHPPLSEADSPFSFGNWPTLLAKSPSKDDMSTDPNFSNYYATGNDQNMSDPSAFFLNPDLYNIPDTDPETDPTSGLYY